MGMTPAKSFNPPQAIGQAGFPNDTVQQSQATNPLPANPFLPLMTDSIPTVQTANAVPNGATGQAPSPYGVNPQQNQAMKYPYYGQQNNNSSY